MEIESTAYKEEIKQTRAKGERWGCDYYLGMPKPWRPCRPENDTERGSIVRVGMFINKRCYHCETDRWTRESLETANRIWEFYNMWKATVPMPELYRDIHKIWRENVYYPAINERQKCEHWSIDTVEEHFNEHI